jgi:coenzyme F420 hydrogenase subunit beta
MEDKSYLDLKKEVWETGKCSRCGACIAVCPADSLFFAHSEGSQTPSHPITSGYCKKERDSIPCGACYRVCPRTDEAPEQRSLLGNYIEVLAGKASFPIERKQSGGAVTAILANALEEKLIDAVVTVTEDRWTLKPSSAIITSSDVMIREAGSRYNWWVPLLASLKEAVLVRKYTRIAVVGVPCTVQALHRMRESDFDLLKPYKDAIRVVIGLFCTESFDYNILVKGLLKEEYGKEPWKVRRMNIKGKMEIELIDGEILQIPLKELDACIPPGCRICTDFTALDADISAGAVGSPEGYTTLIIRTDVGKGFVDHAIASHMLTTAKEVTLDSIERLAGEKSKRRPSKS